jgi:hypothetical protein
MVLAEPMAGLAGVRVAVVKDQPHPPPHPQALDGNGIRLNHVFYPQRLRESLSHMLRSRHAVVSN